MTLRTEIEEIICDVTKHEAYKAKAIMSLIRKHLPEKMEKRCVECWSDGFNCALDEMNRRLG